MSGFLTNLSPEVRRQVIDLLAQLGVERGRIDEILSGSSTVDHGALLGLGDNDHPQYALGTALTDEATLRANADIALGIRVDTADSGIADNVTDIGTNAAAIGVNAANIATNVTDIGTAQSAADAAQTDADTAQGAADAAQADADTAQAAAVAAQGSADGAQADIDQEIIDRVAADALKADITYVDAADALKADTTYVDAADALKADITYVDAADALKADITYVDAADALLAPIASPTFTGTVTVPDELTFPAGTGTKLKLSPGGAGANYTIGVSSQSMDFNTHLSGRFQFTQNWGAGTIGELDELGFQVGTAPTLGDHLTNKTYVDGEITATEGLVTDHINDFVDAHDAAGISYDGTLLSPTSKLWHPDTIIDLQNSNTTIIAEIDGRISAGDTDAIIDAINDWTGGDSTITNSDVFEAEVIVADAIAAGAVIASKIGANAVETSKLAATSVTAAKIATDTITATQIAAGTITTTEIDANTITAGNIAAGTITTTEIQAGTIVATDIASGTITATQIQAGTITTALMTANTIDGDRISAGTLDASKITAGSITTDRMTVGTIDGDRITTNTLDAAAITAGTITTDRMTANTIDGDRITAATLDAAKIVADSITANEIGANVITADEIQVGSLTTATMTANSIDGDRIAAGTLDATKITADSITAGQIDTGAITSDEISAFAITADKIATDALTSSNYIAPGTGGPYKSEVYTTETSLDWTGTTLTGTDSLFVVGDIGRQVLIAYSDEGWPSGPVSGSWVETFVEITGFTDANTVTVDTNVSTVPDLEWIGYFILPTAIGSDFAGAGAFFDLANGTLITKGLLVDGATGDLAVSGALEATSMVMLDGSGDPAVELTTSPDAVPSFSADAALQFGDSASIDNLWWGNDGFVSEAVGLYGSFSSSTTVPSAQVEVQHNITDAFFTASAREKKAATGSDGHWASLSLGSIGSVSFGAGDSAGNSMLLSAIESAGTWVMDASNGIDLDVDGDNIIAVHSAGADVIGQLGVEPAGSPPVVMGHVYGTSSKYGGVAGEAGYLLLTAGNTGNVNGTLYLRTKGTGSVVLGGGGINANRATFNATGMVLAGVSDCDAVDTNYGSAAAPAHSFTSDGDTGMYNESANSLAFATAGIRRVWLNTSFYARQVWYTASTAGFYARVIDSNGRMAYHSSSIRVKKDVEDMELDRAKDIVSKARPVWFRSKNEVDRGDHSFYGLIAEELAEVDPRFVQMRPEDDCGCEIPTDDEGVLPVDWIDYHTCDVHPGGIDYATLVAPLLAVVKDLSERLEVLEGKNK